MALSNELISQFAKLTAKPENTKTETTVYGTAKIENDTVYVKIDGSDRLTPVQTAVDVKDGERVIVSVKDHSATITGNTSPGGVAARVETVKNQGKKIDEFDIIVSYKVTTNDLSAVNATIENLRAVSAKYEDMAAVTAEIETLQAKFATLTYVNAEDVEAINAEITNLEAMFGEFTDISTEDLDAVNAEIDNLKGHTANFTYVSTELLRAFKASIEDLDVKKLSAEEAEIKYVNIDFANIDEAWLETLYAKSGLIQDVTIQDGTITGNLVGVTIKGDIIEGGTVVADKLVIKGTDGLYYKLNTNSIVHYFAEYDSSTGEYTILDDVLENFEGVLGTDYIYVVDAYTTDGDQVFEYVSENNENIPSGTYFCKRYMNNSEPLDFNQVPSDTLHGSIITAKSITAEKVKVSDLVAFGATIGGFHISGNSTDEEGNEHPGAIYSGVKSSVDNSTRGSYLDAEGQFAFGDMENYIRYYKVVDEEGNESYKLEIAAEDILFGKGSKKSTTALEDLVDKVYIGSYEDPDTGEEIPCIELYEGNVESGNVRQFRLRLTNKDATFMDGASDTRIDSDGLTTEKVVANNEIVQTYTRSNNNTPKGEWVWKARPNGNYGLMWKGVTS